MHVVLAFWLLAGLWQTAPEATAPPAAGEPGLTVELLDGRSIQADTVTALSRDSIALSTGTGPQIIPTRDLQAVRWPARPVEPATDNPAAAIEVQLQDGSILLVANVGMRQRMVEIAGPLGPLTLPVAAVRTIRWKALEDSLSGSWSELAARDSRNDLLIVRKGDGLEFFPGVIGEISDKEIKLLLREREVAVSLDRVFGLIFVKAAEAPATALCEVQTVDGQRLRTRDARIDESALAIQLENQPLAIPLTQIAAIDFTLGRVKYLEDLPFEQSQHQASLILTSSVFEVRKNHTSLGQPLRIGHQDYTRGLWMHSGATATFRLRREFRRFAAVIGIDANSMEIARAAPHVKVTISGDGKALLEQEVAWNDDPRTIDLDVSGVRDLEIRVDSPQPTPGILEHLDLGDARVIK